METTFKKALSQIKADDDLKKKTAEYILNVDSNVVSINSAAAVKKKPLLAKRLAAAACIAAVLCALPIGAYAYYKTPTSYISVDINPSVELGINAFGKVVSVKAYNTDGETVIAGLPLVNSNVESAVNLIVKSASQNGFIKDDGSSFISVTAETNNNKKAAELKQNAQAGAEDAIASEADTAIILADSTALDRRDEALALGITPGKLNLIQKLQELDPTIKTDDYKNASVSDIQNKFTELKKDHNGQNDKNDKDDKDDADETASQNDVVSPSASPSDDSYDGKNSDDNNDKQDNHSNGNNNGYNGKSDNDSNGKNDKDDKDDHNNGGGKNDNDSYNNGSGKNNNDDHGNGKGNS